MLHCASSEGQQDQAILIAGGGIGGLAAALALARSGRKVMVLEQAAEMGEIGSGRQLGPNAFHPFHLLRFGPLYTQLSIQ